MSLASRLATSFPKAGHIFRSIEAAQTPLPELRQSLIEGRVEYWWRKIANYGQVWNGAKAEFNQGLAKLRNPGELSVRDVAAAGIVFVQVYGCFKLGEISVRRNIAGYPVPPISEDIFKKF